MSSFELAKGYYKSIDDTCFSQLWPPELVAAHQTLVANRKLTLMLRANAYPVPVIHPGDLDDIFLRRHK